jgi:hypothetical protein
MIFLEREVVAGLEKDDMIPPAIVVGVTDKRPFVPDFQNVDKRGTREKNFFEKSIARIVECVIVDIAT